MHAHNTSFLFLAAYMLNYLFGFIIFSVCLYFYIYVTWHLKTSNNLELYTLTQEVDKEQLDDILDIRQPTLFVQNQVAYSLKCATNLHNLLEKYSNFDVKVRDLTKLSEDSVCLPMHSAVKLFKADKKSRYISENNVDFLTDTSVVNVIASLDSQLRPILMTNSCVDVMFGSDGTTTPLRCELNYRNFFIINSGIVRVKMCPPNNARYLKVTKDYNNLEFRSEISPWVADNGELKAKFLEFEMNAADNNILYIPAFWYYSFKFIDTNSSITNLAYRIFFNNLAILPHLCIYGLQLSNTTPQILAVNSVNSPEL